MNILTGKDLQNAARARKVADLRYKETILLAKQQGWSNSRIARAVGVSEAAIRLYWQRNPQVLTERVKAS